MTTSKKPFKSYTTMSNKLVSSLGCADVYRAYVLSLTTDKTNNTTDTTLEQLASFIGEKATAYNGNSKSLSFTDSLRATECVKVTTSRSSSLKSGNSVTRNNYTFLKGEHFRMVGVEFFNLDLDIKLKGYLLKLLSICNTNTLVLGKSANEIYKTVGVTKATQKKYNTLLIEAGLIEETENGLLLKVEGFNNIEKKAKLTEYTKEVIEVSVKVIASHLKANNTEFSREGLAKCLTNGMDKTSYVIGIYLLNNFKGVKNINNLVRSLQYGKYKKEEKESFKMILL